LTGGDPPVRLGHALPGIIDPSLRVSTRGLFARILELIHGRIL